MERLELESFIALPLETVKNELEKQGFLVKVVCFEKPKIQTDSQLVVRAKIIGEKQVELIVGDFLINKEV